MGQSGEPIDNAIPRATQVCLCPDLIKRVREMWVEANIPEIIPRLYITLVCQTVVILQKIKTTIAISLSLAATMPIHKDSINHSQVLLLHY